MKRLAAGLLGAALLMAACGGSGPDAQENPKDALVSAFENTAKLDGHEMTMSLDASVEAIQALGASQPGDTGMDEDDIEKLLESEIRMATRGTGADGEAEVVVTIGGEQDLTIKVVDQTLYFQADAEGLAETFGADPAELETAAQQAEAQGLAFVKPALEGEWIAITGFQQLQEQMGGPTLEEAERQQKKLMEDFTAAIRDTAEVEHVGDEDAGEHLSVTLPVRDLFSRLLKSVTSTLGPAGSLGPLPDATEIPDESVVLDVWVEDDAISQVAFDLAQIGKFNGSDAADSAGDPALVVVELEEFTGEVEPPDDAVEVEAQQLFQIFGGLMMQGGGSGMPGGGSGMPGGTGSTDGFDCSQLEGAPPNVLKQFADACPELQNQ